jgi:hypothetical protein
MYYKLKTIYLSHFVLRILINLTVTGYFSFLFIIKGFDKYPLYMLALIFKLIGYSITGLIERLFFPHRHHYYRNMGLGYAKVFGTLFLLDFVLMITILTLTYLCQNYI